MNSRSAGSLLVVSGLLLLGGIVAACAHDSRPCMNSPGAPSADVAGTGIDIPKENKRTIFSGTYRTCALRADGAYCWGMIGDHSYHPIASRVDSVPDTHNGHHPAGIAIRVPQLDDAVELAMSELETCVRTSANSVRCYSESLFRGGDPTPRVMGTFTSIVSGDLFVCGLGTNGTVTCWGESNPRAYYHPAPPPKEPMVIPDLRDVVEIAAAHRVACALRKDGSVGCWPEWAGLDDGWPAISEHDAVRGATHIALGGMHGCAVANGTLGCWGSNRFGEFGNGYTDMEFKSFTPSGYTSVRDIALSTTNSCVLDRAGHVLCSGSRYVAMHEAPTTKPEPLRGDDVYSEISAGAFFCALRTKDKAVRCWRMGEEPKDVLFHVPGAPFPVAAPRPSAEGGYRGALPAASGGPFVRSVPYASASAFESYEPRPGPSGSAGLHGPRLFRRGDAGAVNRSPDFDD